MTVIRIVPNKLGARYRYYYYNMQYEFLYCMKILSFVARNQHEFLYKKPLLTKRGPQMLRNSRRIGFYQIKWLPVTIVVYMLSVD